MLPLIERVLTTQDRVAVILEYAETIAPAGETSFSTMDDRAAVVTLHRWSLLRSLEKNDSIVVLIAREPVGAAPRSMVSNPRVATVRVPMPTKERARAAISFPIRRSARRRRAARRGHRRSQGDPDQGDPDAARSRRDDDAERTGVPRRAARGGKPPTASSGARREAVADHARACPRTRSASSSPPTASRRAMSSDARAEIERARSPRASARSSSASASG